MTDNEIIKALECCTDESYENCNECPYSIDNVSCERMKLLEDSLDLINHQKSEIERLEKTEIEIDDFCRRLCRMRMLNGNAIASYEDLQNYIQEEKSEAVKEFAERLKNEIISDTAFACDSSQHTGYYDYKIKIGEIPEYIDSIVKEMVGNEK